MSSQFRKNAIGAKVLPKKIAGLNPGGSSPVLSPRLKLKPFGTMTPYGSGIFQVNKPSQGETWLPGQTYDIKWILGGPSAVVKKITLRKALSQDVISLVISPDLPPGNNKSANFPFTVPKSLQEDDYFVRIEAEETIGNKKKYVADSAVCEASRPNNAQGEVFAEAPHINFAFPNSSGPGIPVVIVGASFDAGAIARINGAPSPICNLTERAIPFVGRLVSGTTVVPSAASRGAGEITVEYRGRVSNAYPFSVN